MAWLPHTNFEWIIWFTSCVHIFKLLFNINTQSEISHNRIRLYNILFSKDYFASAAGLKLAWLRFTQIIQISRHTLIHTFLTHPAHSRTELTHTHTHTHTLSGLLLSVGLCKILHRSGTNNIPLSLSLAHTPTLKHSRQAANVDYLLHIPHRVGHTLASAVQTAYISFHPPTLYAPDTETIICTNQLRSLGVMSR